MLCSDRPTFESMYCSACSVWTTFSDMFNHLMTAEHRLGYLVCIRNYGLGSLVLMFFRSFRVVQSYILLSLEKLALLLEAVLLELHLSLSGETFHLVLLIYFFYLSLPIFINHILIVSGIR